VNQINSLASQIQQYNAGRLKDPQANPGADAQLEANLESLSHLVNFTALKQADGTVTVLVGGGTPLVIGSQQYSISAQNAVVTQPAPVNPNSPPTSQILDSQGNDITSAITGGQLGGLLDSRNRVLGSIIGDAQQAGTLNQLASGLADTVNQILQSGTVSTAPGAAAGIPLFTYDNSDATLAAGSLAVNPAITGAQLAPVDASGNANGNANQLAALANPTGSQGQINGMSYVQFFGQIAASVGQENQTAQNNETSQQQVVSQAQSLQNQISGVSLDGSATQLLQFQRAYEAVSRVLTIVNGLADSILNLVPQI
jgi:flagellar hook-associated protein 1 FlgK